MSIDEHTEDPLSMTCSEKPNSSKQQRVFKKLVKDKKGYYAIIWEEDGEEYEGYSSFSLDVISDFLKEYFMPEQNSPTRMSGASDLISIASETFGILAVCSIRYCQGRQSYMPSMVQDIVREHIRELDDRDLRVLIEDCNSMTDFDFGSATIDKPGWLKFKAELEAEWERRGHAETD